MQTPEKLWAYQIIWQSHVLLVSRLNFSLWYTGSSCVVTCAFSRALSSTCVWKFLGYFILKKTRALEWSWTDRVLVLRVYIYFAASDVWSRLSNEWMTSKNVTIWIHLKIGGFNHITLPWNAYILNLRALRQINCNRRHVCKGSLPTLALDY